MSDDPTIPPAAAPNPSQGDDPISHPLQALPDMAPEPRVYLHPLWWVGITFAVTSILGMIVAGLMHIDASVITTYLTGNLTTHGMVGGGMAADRVTRNNVYSNAAKQPMGGV